jgi:Family of unknown function (DUF6941)
MELTTVMLADGAHQIPPGSGKLYILGGQWDRLSVEGFPAQHPTMAVVLVIKVEYSEALDRHHLEVQLTLDGQPLDPKAVGDLITGHSPGQARGAPTFVSLPLTFNNVVFESPGRYEWVVKVDEQELGRLPIEVIQGGLPGMSAPAVPQPPHD